MHIPKIDAPMTILKKMFKQELKIIITRSSSIVAE